MKLYVGTYAKYAAGSIAGKWMDLDKFESYDDFIAACRRLHKDERDPEFMFQDCEYDPDCDWQKGLYSESSAPREYWDLKKEAEAVAKAEAKKPVSASDKADREEQKRLRAEYRQQMKDEGIWKDDHMLDYCSKSPARIVKLEDGSFLAIDKPAIKTEFCYGEDERGQGGDGPGTMAFANRQCDEAKTLAGFMSNNLGEFDKAMVSGIGRQALHEIVCLNDGTASKAVFLSAHYSNHYATNESKVVCIGRRSAWYRHARPDGARDLTADDIRRIRHAYMVVRADYKKRLAAWWKRFGASKIRTWTYWTEA